MEVEVEDIAGSALKGLLVIIRFILVELFLDSLAYYVGRFSWQLVTLGKYPKEPETKKDREKITLTGVIVIIVTAIVISLVI